MDSFGAGFEMGRVRGNVKKSRVSREPRPLIEPGTARQLEAQRQLSRAEPDLFGDRSIFRTVLDSNSERLAGQKDLTLTIDISEAFAAHGHIPGVGRGD